MRGEAWIPIPEGCRLGLDHLECPPEAVEELREALCPGRGPCRDPAEIRAEVEALRELVAILSSSLERLRVEVEEVEREARLPEEARRLAVEALQAAARLQSLFERLSGSIGAWLCYAVVPHEAPNSSSRERLDPRLRARVKTARETFALHLERLPGVKLAEKGFVYLYFREEDAKRFQTLYETIVEPVRRELERRGYNTISAAACRKILVALDDAVEMLARELEEGEKKLKQLTLELLERRLSGRQTNHLQARVKRLRQRLDTLRAILARIQAAARKVSTNASEA